MKDKIKKLAEGIKRKEIRSILIVAIPVLLIAITTASVVSLQKKTNEMDMSSNNSVSNTELAVAVVGEEDSSIGGMNSNNSWPGELISSEISQIQPQREGVITEWRVNIGDHVKEGQIIGKISAPPATPELIKMLAEQTEAVTKARSQVTISDEFATKEQARLNALKSSLENGNATGSDLTFTSLTRLREKVDVKKKAMRAFVEQAISTHVTTISNSTTWRSFSNSSTINFQYGALDQSTQYVYKVALSSLIEKLKTSQDVPIEDAQNYFALAVKLANNSNDDSTLAFKTVTANDQNGFSTALSDYKDAQAMLADKETEYKLTISEQSSSVEKDRSMAYAEAKASEAAYSTVAGQITGGLYVTSPRSGTISAIYKKVGDLVGPEMPLAVVAGYGNKNITVRMRIPNNTQKPKIGEILSVVRPGFPKDSRKAKLVGIGSSLDETGSYMADAIMIDSVDWPIDSSVRVIGLKGSESITVKTSSIWWDNDGVPTIWAISEADRIFAKKITVGRTLGDSTEVYTGLKNSDRYLINPTLEIQENMFLSEIIKEEPKEETSSPAESGGHEGHNMEGM